MCWICVLHLPIFIIIIRIRIQYNIVIDVERKRWSYNCVIINIIQQLYIWWWWTKFCDWSNVCSQSHTISNVNILYNLSTLNTGIYIWFIFDWTTTTKTRTVKFIALVFQFYVIVFDYNLFLNFLSIYWLYIKAHDFFFD